MLLLCKYVVNFSCHRKFVNLHSSVCLHYRLYNLRKNSKKLVDKCDQSNGRKIFKCVNEFMDMNLKFNNTLSLFNQIMKGEILDDEKSNSLLLQYFELYEKILKNDMQKELLAYGCFEANCRINAWKFEKVIAYDDEDLINNPELIDHIYKKNESYLQLARFGIEVSLRLIVNKNKRKYYEP